MLYCIFYERINEEKDKLTQNQAQIYLKFHHLIIACICSSWILGGLLINFPFDITKYICEKIFIITLSKFLMVLIFLFLILTVGLSIAILVFAIYYLKMV